MAHHKSAKKRIRSDATKNARNHSFISSVRTAMKGFRVAITEDQGAEKVNGLFAKAQSMLARASTKGMMHKNTVSRKTSRLAALLKKYQDGTLETATKRKSKAKKKTKAGKKKKTKAKK